MNLIIVPASHFELGYCGTSGIKVTPIVNLETKSAALTVETWQNGEEVTVTVDGQSKTVPSVDGYAKAEFTIENVHLWDGVDDPYLYTATATLPSGDRVSIRFGCRNYKIDPQKGFILNGRSYPLRGGARHQDCKGVGNALTREHHKQDMEIIRELGANTLRLALAWYFDLPHADAAQLAKIRKDLMPQTAQAAPVTNEKKKGETQIGA